MARQSWLDEKTQTPLIDDYARKLTTFMEAMADGRIDDSELNEQEQRLVALMQEVEPQLDDATHANVTQLLCEMTAYSVMQLLNAIQQSRSPTVFKG
ncbi:MAG: hypothetical protein WBF93_00990 [Pirellulales bacterium]